VTTKRFLATTTLLILIASACSGTNDNSQNNDETTTSSPETIPEQVTQVMSPEFKIKVDEVLSASPTGCDELDLTQCILPFPSNRYTVPDATTPTGRRVAIPADGLPKNATGISIDPSEWNRNDGFSPNSSILTHVADLDAKASALPEWTDLEGSLSNDASVVIIDKETGERIPLWAELDAEVDGEQPLLIVYPAVALIDGHSYVVAMRNLKTTSGADVVPSPIFEFYRDGYTSDNERLNGRATEMEAMFTALTSAGIERSTLQLAWDFTVASTQNLTGRILEVRDNTLNWLDTHTPEYAITSIVPASKDDVAVQVAGTFKLPTHLTGDGSAGQQFAYDSMAPSPNDLPILGEVVDVPFICQVPKVAVDDPSTVLHPGLYGHGLLGSEYEIDYGGDVRALAQEAAVLFCATKWAGMSEDDVGNAVVSLQDLSNFPTVADRLQQGIVNMIALGRLMNTDDGILSDPAFGDINIAGDLVYYGNSQGGIMGSALTAVSPDISRAVLGVPATNYGLLLLRSIDFDQYEAVMKSAYPARSDRTIAISLMQMLWDRGEGGGYINHITRDPLPGTQPNKAVLLHVAWGDHQVSELAAFNEARSLGAKIYRPVVADGRSREVTPGWGLDSVNNGDTGSVIVIWDSGAEMIPIEVAPPRGGHDPHEDPRDDKLARSQMAEFLFDGVFTDVCSGKPCTAQQSG
jgi:hypothetical protein